MDNPVDILVHIHLSNREPSARTAVQYLYQHMLLFRVQYLLFHHKFLGCWMGFFFLGGILQHGWLLTSAAMPMALRSCLISANDYANYSFYNLKSFKI